MANEQHTIGHYPVVWIAIQINIRLNFGCCLRRKHRLTGTTFLRNNINMCSNIKFAYAGGRSEIDYTTHEIEHSTNSAYRGKFPS